MTAARRRVGSWPSRPAISEPITRAWTIAKKVELGLNEEHYARFYSAVTGRQVGLPELLAQSDAIFQLTRLINNRLGMTRRDDSLPYKVRACPIQTGPTAGRVIDPENFEHLLDLYYQKRGWDAGGNPPPEIERQHAGCSPAAS